MDEETRDYAIEVNALRSEIRHLERQVAAKTELMNRAYGRLEHAEKLIEQAISFIEVFCSGGTLYPNNVRDYWRHQLGIYKESK